MLYATTVSSDDDLLQIHQLNQDNLKQNLSQHEKQTEGFVSWLYSFQLLKKMHQLAPSVIVKDEHTLAGYALSTLKESAVFHSDLQTMMNNLREVSYETNPLFSYNFYCMGQICIEKKYRGKGIFNMLYQKHRELYSPVYDLLITEISSSNIRSQKAHEKVGFKTIHQHKDDLDEWNVVVWDWNNSH